MKISEILHSQNRSAENYKIARFLDFFRPISLPERVKKHNEKLILHIGDIPTWGYPYIKRLIREVKPDVLVHTGDLIDNLKAGRKEEDIPRYKKLVPGLIRFMERYADEVYIVPGNNDISDYVQSLVTKSKVIPANTVVEILGLSCLLCHWVAKIDGEAEFYLYGHGPTGDEHSFYKLENGKVFCNAYFAPAVIFPKDKSYMEVMNYNGELHK